MKKLELNQLEILRGEGFEAGYCAGVAGVGAAAALFPTAAAASVAASGGWTAVWFIGSTIYCTGYMSGKW